MFQYLHHMYIRSPSFGLVIQTSIHLAIQVVHVPAEDSALSAAESLDLLCSRLGLLPFDL